MPRQLTPPSGKGQVLTWASDIDERTEQQAFNLAGMPFIVGHAALMADAHLGYGVPIGSVIPTRGAIMPAAVGVDIGCGMIAYKTTKQARHLPDDLGPLLDDFERLIPAGVGQGHDHTDRGEKIVAFMNHEPSTDILGSQKLRRKAASQMGTMGGGNHFLELCLDEHENVWLVLHSGSRGIGKLLADFHIDRAKGMMKRYFIDLPDKDLAFLVEDSDEFHEYIADLLWAQEYAFRNRGQMMNAAVDALRDQLGGEGVLGFAIETRVNCHHNYTEQENHFGKNVWVTRKGAIRARAGELGVIPGSMGASSFIVEGLGNPASLQSASHGAGRRMSRSAARKSLTVESFSEAMADRVWLEGKAKQLLDEHPDAYKNIDEVMRNQADLVAPVAELRAIVNFKGVR